MPDFITSTKEHANEHPLRICIEIADPAALAFLYSKLARTSSPDDPESWNVVDVIEAALAFCDGGL
jgi:hypothetical protein